MPRLEPFPPAPGRDRRLDAAPVLLAAVGLLALTVGYFRASLTRNAGHVAYPLDDVYLHMAVARHLVEHGVWGMTRYGFTSAISSPLWTTLLAGVYGLTGVHESTLLWMTLAFGFALLAGVDRVVRGGRTGWAPGRLVVLAAVVLFMPLGPMVASGMEHVLQTLLTLGFLALAARALTRPRAVRLTRVEVAGLLLLAAGATAVRFEGLFAVAIVAGWCGLRRRFALGTGVVAAGALPVLLFGLLAVSKGWYFLPNSVLLKGNSPPALDAWPELVNYAQFWWFMLRDTLHLRALFWPAAALLVVRVVRQRTIWTEGSILLGSFLALTVLHLQFARTGWFFRYEAYLAALGLTVLGRGLRENLLTQTTAGPVPAWWRRVGWPEVAVAGLLAWTGRPLWTRGHEAQRLTPRAANNIFEQQFQMGQMLREEFPPGTGVAANDIGAINFLADIRCLDLYGLASMEVARAKRAGRFEPAVIRDLAAAAGVRVAMVYDDWYAETGGLPAEWTRVGDWTVPRNYILGGRLVSFYAATPAEVPALVNALRRYAPRLPRDVRQRVFAGGQFFQVADTTYPQETGPGGDSWWTTREATVSFDVTEESETTLRFLILPTRGLSLRISVNGETAVTQDFPGEPNGVWQPVEVPVKLRAGPNSVRLVGEGVPVQPPGDARQLLFALREPQFGSAP